MPSAFSRWMLAGLVGVVAAAGAIVVTESQRDAPAAIRSREFQQLVGGLGFGPAVDLSRCTLAFDPRLSPMCESQFEPIPGGGWNCPHHVLAIFAVSDFLEPQQSLSKATPDATVP